MRRSFLTVAVIAAVSISVLLTGITPDVEATSQRKSSIGDYVMVVDDEDRPRPIDWLEAAVDKANRSVAITGQDSDFTPFWLYVRKGWLESIVPEPAFANHRFTIRSHNGTQWFGVHILNPTGVNVVGVRDFRPEVDRARYTFGSARSISLERPMFVSLSEVPGVRWERRLRENGNGTWWERVPVGVTGLGQFPHTHDGEPRAFYEAYQGILEGTGLTAAGHESRFKTIVNLWADDGGGDWNTLFRDILNDPWGRDSIDVVAIDHYPGTWCCGSNYRDWGALDTLAQIARDYGKQMAIMETGFSSWTWPNGQQDQERFVNEAMDEVWIKGTSNNRNYPLSALLLTSWYELIDTCSGCAFDIEKHFGILTSSAPWGAKLAYDDLRYQVSRWT